MNSFLFYDTETSGLNPAFDQILRFAAIRTDLRLHELERHAVSVKLRPDVIISPQAMATHRIPIHVALSTGTVEFEAARQLHSLLNEPGTISIGYNSMGFDDDFLRFTFHRNLLPPYTHQYGKGCRRMDLLPMVTCYHLYKGNHLHWPERNGRPSLKLEHLNAANELTEGPSHDAMADTEAALALARKMRTASAMWDYLAGSFDKITDGQRLEQLPVAFTSPAGAHHLGLAVSNEFGHEQRFQAPVLSIGRSVPYSNQTLWLRLDCPELTTVQQDTIAAMTWVVRKRLGDRPIILPPHERFYQLISPERQALVTENIAFLQNRRDLLDLIIAHHRDFAYPVIPDLDADAALYQMGFLSTEEQDLCRKYHLLPLGEKAGLIDRFKKPEIRTLAGRILSRNFPEQALPKKSEKDFQTYMGRINPQRPEDALQDFKGAQRMTPAAALTEIQQLRTAGNLDEEQCLLLKELQTDIQQRFC